LTFYNVYDRLSTKLIKTKMPEKITTAELFSEIRGTQVYRTYQQRAEILEKTRSKGEAIEAKSRAIGNSILSLAEVESPAKSALYTMMGNVDPFVRAQAALERNRHAPFNQKEPYLHDVIEFNHSVKTAIDLNPSLGFSETAMLMANVRGATYGPDEAKRFYGDIKPVLNGMRHELASSQIIDATAEFEVDYDRLVTPEDDEHGVDLWIRRIGDEQSFGIDIKASETSAIKSREKSRHPATIIWSHATDSDFGDGFRLPYATAQQKADDMRYDLRRAYSSTTQLSRV